MPARRSPSGRQKTTPPVPGKERGPTTTRSGRLPAAPPEGLELGEGTVNGVAARAAASAGSSSANVKGSGESAGACPAIISSGCFCSSRYFLSFQLFRTAPRVVKTACTSALSTSMSRAGAAGTPAPAGASAPWTDAVGLEAVGPDALGALATLLVDCAGLGSGGGGNSA